MLVIRLARTGRNKYPTYRIVAAESARPATGRFVEVLGHYNPHTKDLVIKHDETLARLSHGAQPSNTVIKLLNRDNVELPAWVKLKLKTPPVVAPVATASDEPTEQEVDAAETTVAPESTAPEASSDAPALSDDSRVGTTVEAEVVTVSDDQVNVNDTDTAASDQAIQDNAEAASDAAAEAAGAKPTE